MFVYIYIHVYIYINIRRPLPSLGLGGAAPGITVGVQHGSCRLYHCHGILYAFRNSKTLHTGTTCHRTTLRLLCHRIPPHRRYKLFLVGSLSTAQPSACFAKTVSIGLRNCYMARFGQALKPSKVPQQLSKASAPHNPPLALPSYLPISPSNCFYWASKLLHGTFWPGLKTFKSFAAAFERLSTAQPSACFAIAPPHRPFKLLLLGFETATWHVLARP